jgi:hypothetical protein
LTFAHKAGLFLLFCLSVLLIVLALGPVTRELTVNLLNLMGLKSAATYVDTA